MQMRVSKVIAEFVGSFFPLFSDPMLGLVFNIDFRARDYRDSAPDFSFAAAAHILITRPCNNAHVYASSGDLLSKLSFAQPFVMKLASTHNSCWIDAIDYELNKVEDLGRHAYQKLYEDIAKSPNPLLKVDPDCWANISGYATFNIFQSPTFVYLKSKKKIGESQPHGYWEIQVDRALTTRQAAEYMNPEPSNYVAWH
jgi:hypothetical protein